MTGRKMVVKGRLLGARFKTYEGAMKRAGFERVMNRAYYFSVEEETDAYHRANGFVWRIRKMKRITNAR